MFPDLTRPRWCEVCRLSWITAVLLLGARLEAATGVFFSEIHYHPVEEAAFTAEGLPVMDLSQDVHEFVELHNNSNATVPLSGWRLAGGIHYDFPAGSQIAPGQYLVIARNVPRIAFVYGLSQASILGPYTGALGNGGDTVRIENQSGQVVDAVSYSSKFPWAISADSLGAEDEWTGLHSSDFQYKGRSLERVSFSWPANDPANWLASPLTGPTPGRANTVSRPIPKPVVVEVNSAQAADGENPIRAGQSVRIDVRFSATNALGAVSVEYFLDDINLTNEARQTATMTLSGAAAAGRYSAVLPGRPDRSVVRYRIRAERGTGVETVSPRADDPYAWHAYFVTPLRTSANPIFDCFISTASLNTLSTNIVDGGSWSERRIVPPNPPGQPRTSWNATQPAVMVHDGVVYDIQVRYHGSQYHRTAARNSFKWQFPRYQRFDGLEGTFMTDKDLETAAAHTFFRMAGLPSSYTRFVDLYLNSTMLVRLQETEMDGVLYDTWANEVAAANPGTDPEPTGEFYKAQGVFLFEDPLGPYGFGGFHQLPPSSIWTPLQRYEWTYSLQMHGWKGYTPLAQLIQGLWAARADLPTAVGPNLVTLRAFLEANFDVDAVLTHMALRTWMGVWDDFNHNTFLWRRANGRYGLLPWDFDAEFGAINPDLMPTITIYLGEFGAPTGYHQPDWVDANWIKDSFYKAFRTEYKRKLFILNNTLLNPTNISSLGFGAFRTYADARFASVNQQVGLGAFNRPRQPTHLNPVNNAAALVPAQFVTSPYSHTATPAPAQQSTTWFIRAEAGTYAAPVFKLTSSSNLTSLPIPFEQLNFGETYFWKCVYTDTNGHPSIDSAETAFVYGAHPTRVPLVSIDATTLWRYNRSGSAPAGWNLPGFDDRAWPEGAALLADETAVLPEPIRTPFARGTAITFYFRTRFNFNGDPASASLRLRQIIDDGVVIYLNGVEVWRSGMPPGPVSFDTLAARSVGDAIYEGPFSIPAAALVAGENVIAAEVHQQSPSSSDIVFGVGLEAYVPPAPGALVLSEILAENHGSALNANHAPDYIELHNTSAVAVNLNGMSISDNVERPGKYIFPPNTVVPADGYLVLWCDDATNTPGLHTGFALDNDGQTVALFLAAPGGYELADAVTFGLQAPDFSIGRSPPPGNAWSLNTPTPGGPNIPASLGVPASLRVNEWMASDANGPDWFEIYNPSASPVALGGCYVTDKFSNPTNTRLAALSFIGPFAFRQFIADDHEQVSARHVGFQLSAGGEAIALFDPAGNEIDSVVFGPQTSGISQGRLPDGSATFAFFPGSSSPETPNFLLIPDLVINEVLPNLELLNTGSAAVDLGGLWLSDDPSQLQKYQIPAGNIIPPGGFWWAEADALPLSFDQLSGGRVYLSRSDGYRTSAKYGPYDGFPYGIVQTTVGQDFVQLSAESFGAPNPPPRVGPIVISEIQYHPPDLPADDDQYEFVELVNLTGGSVPLFDPAHPVNRWRLRDACSFTFPPATTLAPGETVLVVGFDPTNETARANFQMVYGLPPGLRLFGPYAGKLDNSGASVELVKPAPPVTTPGPGYASVAEILIDRVHYSDAFPWPDAADGLGRSLQRKLLTAYGNEPTNWSAAAVSPGAPNTPNLPPTVVLTVPSPGSSFNPFQPLTIAANAQDPDGSILRVEFFADGLKIGEDWAAPFSFAWTNAPMGTHVLMARATDRRLDTAQSPPVNVSATNAPPSVVLTSPAPGAVFSIPSVIMLQASASDVDGTIAKVEFFANTQKLGEATTSPYSLAWSNLTVGTFDLTARATDSFGLVKTSPPVSVRLDRNSFVAYVVPSGTIGAANYINGLGADFDVASPILVTSLGVFDNAGDGIHGSSTMTAQIYRRNGNTGTLLASMPFQSISYGKLIDGSRFKVLPQPLVLSNGSYSIACYGFSASNRLGDLNLQSKTWSTDSGGGLISFVGSSRFGLPTPGAFPSTNLSGGAVDNFAAGTFEFRRLPTQPVVIDSPTSVVARAGTTVNFQVTAYSPAAMNYQWFFAGAALPGRTAATLSLTNVQAANIGGYFAIVSNGLGSATSDVATLSLILPPTFVRQPQPVTVLEGGTARFDVEVGGTPPFSYRWRRNAQTVVPFPGAPFFVITNVPLSYHGSVIDAVVASTALGVQATSAGALLQVLADFDHDGMADEWEAAFNLNTNSVADATIDSDGDGQDNRSEYIAGTNPRDPRSFLKVERIAQEGTAVSLEFEALSNRTYRVLYKGSLDDLVWTKLLDVEARPTNRLEKAIDAQPGAPTRYYRLATPAEP